MLKKAQITLFIIIAIILVGNVVIITLIREKGTDTTADIPECQTPEQCVAASCCHATSCVSITDKPDCTGIFCTEICMPGTLDCPSLGASQLVCKCINNKCEAVPNE